MKPTIYIVDDEPEMRNLIKDFLSTLGYQGLTFSSPIQVLKRLREDSFRPTAVISDVKMSPMNGIDFLAIVKRDFPEIPILLVSASMSQMERAKALKLGAEGLLMKPFSLLELERTIKQIVEEQMANSAQLS